MVVVLFVLGRPGSGKSTAVQHCIKVAHQHGWQTVRIKDYEILYDLFRQDTAQQRFRPAPFGAFDVIDFTVLDEVLRSLQDQVRQHLYSQAKKLVIVEFARDEYQKALATFDESILSLSYFLLVEARIDACIHRIHTRIQHQVRQDNHYVSAEILRAYYCRDNRRYFLEDLAAQHNIEQHKISIIENNSSYSTFINLVDQFIAFVLLKTPVQTV
jgi:adenylate kinase family enzyme